VTDGAIEPGRRRAFLVTWMLALAFGAAAFALSQFAYERLPRPQPLEELSYYPSGNHLRLATLGHAESAGDLAWLRAVQYYGEHRRSDNLFVKMEHVFDILTTLAPGFVPAYVFGGFSLAQEGKDFPAAERLMLKGIEANPRSGTLAFELGFMYYVRPGGRELPKAAQYFEQAAYQPDAPPQARRFAAFARQSSGNLWVSYELWRNVLETSNNAYLREAAEREMTRIRQVLATGGRDTTLKRLGTPQVQIGNEP
jgi:hypothetical protein